MRNDWLLSCGNGEVGVVAATQSAHQGHLGIECAGSQINTLPTLVEHRSLSGKDIEKIAQSCFITLHGNLIGVPSQGLRSTLLDLLTADRLP